MTNTEILLTLSGDLICTLDAQGRFVAVNDACETILGFTPGEMRGRSYTNFLESTDLHPIAEALGGVKNGLHRSGKLVPLRWSAQWDDERQLLYAVGREETAPDIREMKKINRELQEFGYIVSHNLRSPVANIMGIAALLETDQDDPETVSYCAGHLKSAITRLDEVIRDLSEILSATDRSAELSAECVDLSGIVRDIQTDLGPKIARNQARIEVTPGTFWIRSHKAYVYSIFFNLISNAIKYRSADVPVISICIRPEKLGLCLVFSDNGCGIDLERHGADLFKPYKRFHAHIEGKGLGMFLVKSHVEALGGEISVASQPGKGTCFTIRLPQD